MSKISWFKSMNAVMTTVCVGFFAVSSRYGNVHILDSNKATSNIRGNNFEFSSNERLFSMRKNGELAGLAITDNGVKFRNSLPTLQCNAIFVGGALIAGTMAGTAALGTVAEATVAGAAAVAGEAIPGATAVAATLGGAGEAAAIAAADAAATAAAGAGAVLAEVGTALAVGAGVGLILG